MRPAKASNSQGAVHVASGVDHVVRVRCPRAVRRVCTRRREALFAVVAQVGAIGNEAGVSPLTKPEYEGVIAGGGHPKETHGLDAVIVRCGSTELVDPGLGAEVTEKSPQLDPVSEPSGRRTRLSPGGMLGGSCGGNQGTEGRRVSRLARPHSPVPDSLARRRSRPGWNALGAQPVVFGRPQPDTVPDELLVSTPRPTPPPTLESSVVEVWVKLTSSDGCVPAETYPAPSDQIVTLLVGIEVPCGIVTSTVPAAATPSAPRHLRLLKLPARDVHRGRARVVEFDELLVRRRSGTGLYLVDHPHRRRDDSHGVRNRSGSQSTDRPHPIRSVGNPDPRPSVRMTRSPSVWRSYQLLGP